MRSMKRGMGSIGNGYDGMGLSEIGVRIKGIGMG